VAVRPDHPVTALFDDLARRMAAEVARREAADGAARSA
jgi:hypothetical protein